MLTAFFSLIGLRLRVMVLFVVLLPIVNYSIKTTVDRNNICGKVIFSQIRSFTTGKTRRRPECRISASCCHTIATLGLRWIELPMHRIPRFFDRRRNKDMDAKQKARGPKLERRLAKKNIDYEPSSSSSLSEDSEQSPALRTRSLDLSPLDDRTSFRYLGNEGELEILCRSLGLSGPEDFAIPIAAWEARKARSSSDLLPRSRLQQVKSSPEQLEHEGTSDLPAGFTDTTARVGDVPGSGCDESTKLNDCSVSEMSDRFGHSFTVSSNDDSFKSFLAPPPSLGRGGGGIKGVRPPFLAPPPSILRPVIDNSSSTWDILKSFAPDHDDEESSPVRGFVSSDDEEIEKPQEDSGVMTLRDTVVLSESCSFTTSNDDDSSSTTTEVTSNISPNGRSKRIITSWEKGELLGSGSFGSVYEGIADGGFFIAVKEVSLLDQGEQGRQSIYQLEQEIALLSQFEHENIVQYYGTEKDESKFYIFLELVTKGSLMKLYQTYTLRDSQVSVYTRQILHGLKYLHERDVVHRDIKCANILVDASGSVKLADFGLAKATKLNDVKSCKGTAFWMAPEVVKGRSQGYGLAADIWSLGCTVLEMLTRRVPYSHLENPMQALYRIGRGEPPPVPDSLSSDARDFIHKCLQVDPNARPTAPQLLNHPFVRSSLPFLSGSSSPYNSGQRA